MLALKAVPTVLGTLNGKKKPAKRKRFRPWPFLVLFLLGIGAGVWLRDYADAPIDKARCVFSVFK